VPAHTAKHYVINERFDFVELIRDPLNGSCNQTKLGLAVARFRHWSVYQLGGALGS
jgi:hypothetical protein